MSHLQTVSILRVGLSHVSPTRTVCPDRLHMQCLATLCHTYEDQAETWSMENDAAHTSQKPHGLYPKVACPMCWQQQQGCNLADEHPQCWVDHLQAAPLLWQSPVYTTPDP